MKRPSRIKVLNLDYTVHWHDTRCQEQTGSYGQQSLKDQTIRLNGEATPQSIADTFLHEVVHALFDGLGLDEKAPEETVARRLSSGLCTVWKDNPKAFAWWQSLL